MTRKVNLSRGRERNQHEIVYRARKGSDMKRIFHLMWAPRQNRERKQQKSWDALGGRKAFLTWPHGNRGKCLAQFSEDNWASITSSSRTFSAFLFGCEHQQKEIRFHPPASAILADLQKGPRQLARSKEKFAMKAELIWLGGSRACWCFLLLLRPHTNSRASGEKMRNSPDSRLFYKSTNGSARPLSSFI